jgi:uncharacterized membrane protein
MKMVKNAKNAKNAIVVVTLFVSGVILIILDAIFLYINRNTFEIQIADVQRVVIQPKYLGFVLCYLLLIFGLYWFILRTRRPVWEAILLGIFVYGVYETTNYGTLKKWRLKTMLIDTLWGGALFGLTTAVTYEILDI